MFRLASFDLAGRRILVVEDDDIASALMVREIAQSGGVVMGPVADVEAALALIGTGAGIDCAMLDVRLLAETALPVIRIFQDIGVELVFVTSFDDWFASDDV